MMDWYALVGEEVIGPFQVLDMWYQANAGLTWRMQQIHEGKPDPWLVALTELADGGLVSTVFLGLDHGWGDGLPVVFETMVFPECETCIRSCTWDEAVNAHALVVASLIG